MSFSNLKSQQKKGKQPSKPSRQPRINKEALKKELRILIECATFGRKKFLEYPEYSIQDSVMLKARMHELIELISK